MATLTRDGMKLTVEGASAAELDRGLRAAMRVFEAADVSPQAAARAEWDLEGVSVSFGDPGAIPHSPAMQARAQVWWDAGDAAMNTCCEGWPEVPEGSSLELAD